MLLVASAELTGRMSRCGDLESLMDVALCGLDELLGYRHSSVMLLDEEGTRLFTIASHGFPSEGVGSELELGDGVAGAAVARCEPVRVRVNCGRCRSTRTRYGNRSTCWRAIGAGIDVPLPTLGDAQSCMAVPALARGELVGVLTVESPLSVAFEDEDEAVLKVIATVVAQMIDIERSNVDAADRSAPPVPAASTTPTSGETHIRFFGEDGSVFLDGEYLIRGVAGRILWSSCSDTCRRARPSSPTRNCR